MKKLTLFGLSVIALATFALFNSPETQAEKLPKGKWIDVYDGNTSPVGAVCASALFTGECIVGDTITYLPNS